MKIKNISTLLVQGMLLISFIYAGSISPTLTLRFNDVSASTALVEPVQALGLRLGVGEGVYSGVESDGTDFRLYIPTAFTPNNDNVNDVFKPVGIPEGIREYEMSLWDRWGHMFFKTNNLEEGWVGTKEGIIVKPGSYIYYIRVNLRLTPTFVFDVGNEEETT